MVTLAQRNLSGKGLLRIDKSSEDFLKAKIITVYADVLRPPRNKYANYAYNPPRGRFATLNFMYKGYVVRSEAMEFDSQVWIFSPELDYQHGYALQCAYDGILQSFVNLGVALAAPPISVTNNIESWNHTDLFWDEIRVVCYADTAITLTAEAKPYDLCPEQEDKGPDLPPPPPDLPPPVPPGQPLGEDDYPGLSGPYEDPDSPDDQVPFPGDVVPPEPPVNVPGTWRFIFRGDTAGSTTFDDTAPGFSLDAPGIISEPNSSCLDGSAYHIVATARGNVRYYPGSFRLSTCGSGPLVIISQNFSPSP